MKGASRKIHLPVCELLGITEVSSRLGMSYWTVRQLILDQKIDAIKIGGRWKVPRSSLERFISESVDDTIQNGRVLPDFAQEYSDYLWNEIMGGSDD